MDAVDPVEGHTSRTVDQSLIDLRLRAMEMGGLVIDQVGSAVKALLDRDVRLAELVLSREPLVNDYDARLDRDSLTFIALQQPVANDLRMVRAVARPGGGGGALPASHGSPVGRDAAEGRAGARRS